MEAEQTAVHNKLYIITHRGLSSGYQTAQSIHAATEFTMNHPEHAKEWYKTSNTVVCLEAESSEALSILIQEAVQLGILHAPFYEPDLDDELTAIAFAPSASAKELLSQFPLVGRRKKSQDSLQDREFQARQNRRDSES